MGKLLDLAGAVEDAVSSFGDLVKGVADDLLRVPNTFYIGDRYEVGEVLVITRDGSIGENTSVTFAKGDRITHLSSDSYGVFVECRHKLASGDSERTQLFLTFGEWTLLRGRVVLTWTNQDELAKLHKAQGHG